MMSAPSKYTEVVRLKEPYQLPDETTTTHIFVEGNCMGQGSFRHLMYPCDSKGEKRGECFEGYLLNSGWNPTEAVNRMIAGTEEDDER